jgi:hypothetical protein
MTPLRFCHGPRRQPDYLGKDRNVRTLEELAATDRTMRGLEFARLVKHYAGARGRMENALTDAEQSKAPERVRNVLKTAVTAGSSSLGSPSPWGAE